MPTDSIETTSSIGKNAGRTRSEFNRDIKFIVARIIDPISYLHIK